jgi:hypothetical protein
MVTRMLRTRGQNRRGHSELILHRYLDEFRCLRLKLDKIRCHAMQFLAVGHKIRISFLRNAEQIQKNSDKIQENLDLIEEI